MYGKAMDHPRSLITDNFNYIHDNWSPSTTTFCHTVGAPTTKACEVPRVLAEVSIFLQFTGRVCVRPTRRTFGRVFKFNFNLAPAAFLKLKHERVDHFTRRNTCICIFQKFAKVLQLVFACSANSAADGAVAAAVRYWPNIVAKYGPQGLYFERMCRI